MLSININGDIMVDFGKLRKRKVSRKPIEPEEIFRRLPKPSGINDLYTSQAEVLREWFSNRDKRDIVIKLHTGGGKTLVGLLIAQSTNNETSDPVLYLAPTVQLVKQTLEKAKELGIPAVPYENERRGLCTDFVNGDAIMVGTYKSLFNGQSKFGLRGSSHPQSVAAIILDDAHAAFSVIRESFTLEINSQKNKESYQYLAGLFRKAFDEINRIGTYDDILSGSEYSVIEVPYWSWQENINVVREHLKVVAKDYPFQWPLLRDKLHLCHALISRNNFTITPFLPLVDLFPTFFDASRRIYMSATIADDSEIIRTFNANPKMIADPLTSRSLAGISERLILIPDFMKFEFNIRNSINKLIDWTVKQNFGAVILVPSNRMAEQWKDVATVAIGSEQVEEYVKKLQEGAIYGPVVFANRYDGIDLPGNSCRLLVMDGLPLGTSNYELFRASALYGGQSIIRLLAQRIEQGIGRGARGAGDHCVVLLSGPDLAGWVAKEANFRFLTNATKAQLEMGDEISKEVRSLKEFVDTIRRSYMRDPDWVEYHAETLADLIDETVPDQVSFRQAAVERKAVNLWQDGYYEKALKVIDKFIDEIKELDLQSMGWMKQLAARIANAWGKKDLSEEYQRSAYADNRNLFRPKVPPVYQPISVPTEQADAIIEQITKYRYKKGFMRFFEETCSLLHHNSSSGQFEQALADLAKMIGIASGRYDDNGEGPDVLWLLPNKTGFVIEAKSRKEEKNSFTKKEHGQLLVAAEWFKKNYKDYKCIRVSVHPQNKATKAANAGSSYVLTYENLNRLTADARTLLTSLCELSLSTTELSHKCRQLLTSSGIRYDLLVDNYLIPFEEQ